MPHVWNLFVVCRNEMQLILCMCQKELFWLAYCCRRMNFLVVLECIFLVVDLILFIYLVFKWPVLLTSILVSRLMDAIKEQSILCMCQKELFWLAYCCQRINFLVVLECIFLVVDLILFINLVFQWWVLLNSIFVSRLMDEIKER